MKPLPLHARQRGLALVCALMLMLCTLILGASIARTAFGSMASSRMERERMVARAGAEAALADAQADIGGGAQPSAARAAWFASGSGGFVAGCGQGSQDLGLCLPAPATGPAAGPAPWQAIDLADADAAPLVPYGRYTGATLALGGGMLPARLPAYLIERLDGAGPGPPSAAPSSRVYRITAIGFGTRAATRVVLQAVYRRPAAVPPPGEPIDAAGTGETAGTGDIGAPGENRDTGDTGGTEAAAAAAAAAAAQPAGRIGWREIANWPELHARAVQAH